MHHSECSRKCRRECPQRFVCRCLKVTEEALLEAVRGLDIKTLKEMRVHTGAGDGCTVCHKVLRTYLEEAAA